MKSSHLAALATAFTLASSQLHGQDIAITPDQLKFNTNPATGSQLAVIMGHPAKPGPFVVRVRYPAGLQAMPHSHPNDTLITVISGTLRFAEGTTFDESKLKDYPAGSFLFQRANVPHYEMATGPMEFEAHGTGPMAFNFVDPKHDPKNR